MAGHEAFPQEADRRRARDLRVLWTRGPSTVREVAESLGREGAYTTILKLLQIMTEKRLVRRDVAARTHVYEAAGSEERHDLATKIRERYLKARFAEAPPAGR